MRREAVKEQIQWILLYVQKESADVWKENILEDLEARLLEYETAREFLADIKKEFGERNKEIVQVAELKRLEQEGKTMEEFVQEFRRVAKDSRYQRRPLVKEFKRSINRTIYQKLMDSEQKPCFTEQQYDWMIALDKNWRESKKDKERLRRKRDNRAQK